MSDEKEEYIREFIELENLCIEIRAISSFEKKEDYNYHKHLIDYKIIFNIDPTEKIFYANYTLIYEDKELRDKMYEDIKSIMKKSNVKFLSAGKKIKEINETGK